MSGGWIGILLTISIVGWLAGKLYKGFCNPQNIYSVLLYIMTLPVFLLWFRDGGINVIKMLLFILFPILVWKMFYNLMVKQRKRFKAVTPTLQPVDIFEDKNTLAVK